MEKVYKLMKKTFLIIGCFLVVSWAKAVQLDPNIQILKDYYIHSGKTTTEMLDKIDSIDKQLNILTTLQQIEFYLISSQLIMNQNRPKSRSLAHKGLFLAKSNNNNSQALLFEVMLLNLGFIQNKPITKQDVKYVEQEVLLMKDSYEKALALLYLSRIHKSFDDFFEQLTCLNSGLEILDKINMHSPLADKLKAEFNNEFGNFYIILKDYTNTTLYFNKALKLFKSINNQSRIGMLYFNMGLSHQQQQQYSQASKYFSKVIDIKKKLQEPYGLGLGYLHYGITMYYLKKIEPAKSYIKLAIPQLEKAHAKTRLTSAYLYQAKIQILLDQPQQASQNILAALKFNNNEHSISKKIDFFQEVFLLLMEIENDELRTKYLNHVFNMKDTVMDTYHLNMIKRLRADSKLINSTTKNKYLSDLTNIHEKNIQLQKQANTIQKYWIVGLMSLTFILIISILRQLDVNKENKQLAYMDSLTGVMNRRAYFDSLKKVYSNVVVEDSIPYLVLLDIDFFKKINDEFGHSIGDKVLADLGLLLKQNIRHGDEVARIGGEEFAIIHHATVPLQAIEFCQKVIASVSIKKWSYEENDLNVTISLGVTEISNKKPLQEIINETDRYMYKAKSNGRNRMETNLRIVNNNKY